MSGVMPEMICQTCGRNGDWDGISPRRCEECGGTLGHGWVTGTADIDEQNVTSSQPGCGEVEEALRLPNECCTSCGTHLDKHDYAFFRIGRLRSEIELTIRLLKQGVSAQRVIRELEQVLMDTMSNYRPSKR